MRLDRATWCEVDSYLQRTDGIIIPVGSTEQHGPVGLIGTDAICAARIAEAAAECVDALVAPTLAYSPAPFNLGFAGTVSIAEEVFEALAKAVVESLHSQGFRHFYFLNAHGANLKPLASVARNLGGVEIRVRNWWDFEPVQELRSRLYGEWEGLHATPSEISVTRATDRSVESSAASNPPERLSREFIRAHAGDKHGPPQEHRAKFPDGRVGSHSALAKARHGRMLLDAASESTAQDYATFLAAADSGLL